MDNIDNIVDILSCVHHRGRLGSCCVPLQLLQWSEEKLTFSMDPEHATIVVDSRAMYGLDEVAGPLSSQGTAAGGPGAAQAAAAGGLGSGAQGQHGTAVAAGFAIVADEGAADDMQQSEGGDDDDDTGSANAMGEAEEEEVESVDLPASFAQQLELLVSAEEVMGDFALFDGAGRLLMGR
jgi:hypothetical protein